MTLSLNFHRLDDFKVNLHLSGGEDGILHSCSWFPLCAPVHQQTKVMQECQLHLTHCSKATVYLNISISQFIVLINNTVFTQSEPTVVQSLIKQQTF